MHMMQLRMVAVHNHCLHDQCVYDLLLRQKTVSVQLVYEPTGKQLLARIMVKREHKNTFDHLGEGVGS